jgi:cephalosporin hydroxylase
MSDFQSEVDARIAAHATNDPLKRASSEFLRESIDSKYSYNFSWLGRPIIQYPQDIVAMQELVWRIKPDLIIETGIARGGSLILSASLLALLDVEDAIATGRNFDPRESARLVLGVDIDIRSHNKDAIEQHPMSSRIKMIQGSSIASDVIAQVRDVAARHRRVMVCLDSNHTHDHVLAELEAYAPMVSLDSYCIVFDTVVEYLPAAVIVDRPWGPGNNPKTAVLKYLENRSEFVIDKSIDHKLQISVAPEGFLRRVA